MIYWIFLIALFLFIGIISLSFSLFLISCSNNRRQTKPELYNADWFFIVKLDYKNIDHVNFAFNIILICCSDVQPWTSIYCHNRQDIAISDNRVLHHTLPHHDSDHTVQCIFVVVGLPMFAWHTPAWWVHARTRSILLRAVVSWLIKINGIPFPFNCLVRWFCVLIVSGRELFVRLRQKHFGTICQFDILVWQRNSCYSMQQQQQQHKAAERCNLLFEEYSVATRKQKNRYFLLGHLGFKIKMITNLFETGINFLATSNSINECWIFSWATTNTIIN